MLQGVHVDLAVVLRGFCKGFTWSPASSLQGVHLDFAIVLLGFCKDFAWSLAWILQ